MEIMQNWCTNNAKNCVQGILVGDFPHMVIKAYEQYQAGNRSATGNSMYPIGENNAFCTGWDSNNGDYGGQDCSDSPLANISWFLIGCPEDILTNSQIGGLHALVGKWNFMNQTESEVSSNMPGISGTFLFNNNGYMKMTVPTHNGFGNYELESSWGYIGHNILTLCYAGGCENSTLISINPTHIKFKDHNGNTIHLMRSSYVKPQQISPEIEVGATAKSPEIEVGATADSANISHILNLTGTWAMVNPDFKSGNNLNTTITFDNYLRHAHWNYTQYCCVVNIEKFTAKFTNFANVGHRTFEGYWRADLSPPSFPFPSTLELCTNNIQDHGVYHSDVDVNKGILSGCTKMTVNIIDKDNVNLSNPAGDTIYLIRLVVTKHLEPVN